MSRAIDAITREPQLEGIEAIREMGSRTNVWRYIDCGVGNLYLGGNDDGIAMRFLHGFVYEPVTLAVWQWLCRDAPLVIDVGAHTGLYSLAAFKAHAEIVVSIEPYYLNAARLSMNLRANGYSPAGCLVGAVGDTDEVRNLAVPLRGSVFGYCTGASTLHPSTKAASMPVRVRPLDTWIDPEQYSFIRAIKFDVEYWLRPALMGASRILAHQPDLLLEVFEPHVAELLTSFGYRFWAIHEYAGLRLTPDLSIQPVDGNRNYLASARKTDAEMHDWVCE